MAQCWSNSTHERWQNSMSEEELKDEVVLSVGPLLEC
jgi:hypothetical protein